MAHVFVSYDREDLSTVTRLAQTLSSFGITVWLDRDSIKAGSRWKDAIRDGIDNGAFFLACFSRAYFERERTYMNEELTLAIEGLRQRPTDQAWFIPVLLDDCPVPRRSIGGGEQLSDLQHVRLFEDWADGIRRILAVVQPISSMEFTLRESLSSPSARARITAADSLGKMGPVARDSAPALLQLLDDANDTVRAAAADALGKIGAATRDIVLKLLEITPNNGHPYYPSKHANAALVKMGKPAIPILIQVVCEHGLSRNSIGEAAAKTLCQLGEAVLPYAAEILTKGESKEKTVMAEVMRGITPSTLPAESNARRDSVTALIEMLSSPSESTDDARASAAEALGSLGDPMAVPALIGALRDPNYLCVCAASALAQIKHPDAIPHLVAVLEDSNKFWVPRGAAAVALGQFGEGARSALPALQRARAYDCDKSGETWDVRAREAVEDAIVHITDPSAQCRLKGRGYEFEMWGIY
jgi:HEAT repeat protein